MRFINVVFPEPVSPRIPSVCPGSTVKLISKSALTWGVSGKAKSTCWNWTAPRIGTTCCDLVVMIVGCVFSIERILIVAAEKRWISLINQPLIRIGWLSIHKKPLNETSCPRLIWWLITRILPSSKTMTDNKDARKSKVGRYRLETAAEAMFFSL